MKTIQFFEWNYFLFRLVEDGRVFRLAFNDAGESHWEPVEFDKWPAAR